MQTPAAMSIYTAQQLLKARPSSFVQDELKELRESNANGSFEDGYLLGLETARAILLGNPELDLKGIDPKSLL